MEKWFNRLHMMVHLVLGVLIAALAAKLSHHSFGSLIPFAVVGSFLPDLDHLAFFFTYGRKTAYSLQVKAYLKKVQIKQAAHFCAYNHKTHNGLYTHTWYGVMAVVVGAVLSLRYSISYGVLFLGMIGHFAFDIVEDVLLKGGINGNWKGRVIKYPAANRMEDRQ